MDGLLAPGGGRTASDSLVPWGFLEATAGRSAVPEQASRIRAAGPLGRVLWVGLDGFLLVVFFVFFWGGGGGWGGGGRLRANHGPYDPVK